MATGVSFFYHMTLCTCLKWDFIAFIVDTIFYKMYCFHGVGRYMLPREFYVPGHICYQKQRN